MVDKIILVISLVSLGLTIYAIRDQLFPPAAVNFVAQTFNSPGVQI